MAFSIDHNVLVVAVLDLEDVLHERIGSKTVTKVFLSFLEPPSFNLFLQILFGLAVHDCEVFQQSESVRFLVDLVDAHCIVDDLDQATIRPCG